MEVSGQLHAPAALLVGKELLIPIVQEAGWAPEPVRTRWWREKFPAPAGNRTLDHPALIIIIIIIIIIEFLEELIM
jgi:hypothetical protein